MFVKKARFETRCIKAWCTGRTRRLAFFWRKKEVARGTWHDYAMIQL